MRDRLSTKSMSVNSGGFVGRRCVALFSLFSLCMLLNFSAIRARDEAVEAFVTGILGRELRKGGETLGGGTMILALRDGLFEPCGTPRPGEVILAVLGRPTERVDLALGFCVWNLLGVVLDCDGSCTGAACEFGVELPESEAPLSRRLLTGIREVGGGLRSDTGEARRPRGDKFMLL